MALALVRAGSDVGLLDADILGPSVPGMLGLPTDHQPGKTPEGKAVPAVRHGLKAVSMGLLSGDDNPSILRGPMVAKYLQMFVSGVDWGHLDYLIMDLPPGTGDTQLTLAQSLPAVWGGHRDDSTAREPEDRSTRATDVPGSARPHPRGHREHEHVFVPALPARARTCSAKGAASG